MPRIKEYTRQVASAEGPLRVSRIQGSDLSSAGALSGLGQSVEGVGDALFKRAEQANVSDLSLKLSELNTKQDIALKEAARNPSGYAIGDVNDPNSMTNQLMKSYEDDIQKISESANTPAGRRFLEESAAKMRSQFQINVFKTQADLAGQQAKFNAQKSIDLDTAYLRSNPSALATMRGKSQAYLESAVQTGSLKAEDALQMQMMIDEKFGVESIRGWIDGNPQQTLQDLKKGVYDAELKGGQKSQMINEAEAEIAKREADQTRRTALNDKWRKEQARVEELSILQKGMDGALNGDDIMKSKFIDADDKVKWIKWMGDHYADKMKTVPAVFNDLYKRVTADPGDPYKITSEKQLQEFLGKGLAFQDMKILMETLGDEGVYATKAEKTMVQNFEKMAERTILKPNAFGIADPENAQRFYQFLMDYKQKYRDFRAQGKNPEQLLDPNSPEYMGKNMGAFIPTPQELVRQQVKALKAGAPGGQAGASNTAGFQSPVTPPAPPTPVNPAKARLPGETLQQWRERTKGM
jgi:hypothetical protein